MQIQRIPKSGTGLYQSPELMMLGMECLGVFASSDGVDANVSPADDWTEGNTDWF